MDERYVRRLSDLGADQVAVVGGKNASIGEMIRRLGAAGVRVPGGFATTVDAYWQFLDASGLRGLIADQIDQLHAGADLAGVGAAIRRSILDAAMPAEIARAVTDAYRDLAESLGRPDVDVAVRSSATAEDRPEASFAGQQETFLNVTGEQAVLDACRHCFASLFTDRAISYREHHGFDHQRVALSVGVQPMVRADLACAGVIFSIDTETGFPHNVVIDASWGLGEAVVGGQVDPDEYVVFKPLLDREDLTPIIAKKRGSKRIKIVYGGDSAGGTRMVDTDEAERSAYVLDDREILTLARWATAIEAHYGTPMDIEWAKDGITGELFVVQARPETVHARRQSSQLRSYRITGHNGTLVTGLAVGEGIASGEVCNLESAADLDRFRDGSVLVTSVTDPDWEPIMKRAAAIVTGRGGRTSHAAIVSRELGVPAIVGAGQATRVLTSGRMVTVSCAEGAEGRVYDGVIDYEQQDVDLGTVPKTRTQVMLNVANPAAALRWWRLPADGIGLARIEFIIANQVQAHPMALVHFDQLTDADARQRINDLTRGYKDRTEYFVEHLAHAVAQIAASQFPSPVIVRLSDFKTNEYARLIGGRQFEPQEENPMIGWRGASRYYSDYREGFLLECRAMRRVRDEIGLTNVVLMIPVCRTLEEADRVLDVMSQAGLVRGRNGLEVYVMAEVPSNILLAEGFADRFDGFSIGSNDLTQLTLGVDRDSAALAHLFDERNLAVIASIERLIAVAHDKGVKVGLCGQRPSDDPDYARLLVRAGIDSISVTPDSFLRVKDLVAAAERDDGARHPRSGPS
jgi:pyruvate, water dikinase